MRAISSACHLDSILQVDLDVVVQNNQNCGFLLKLEVDTSTEILVNDEDSFRLFRNLVRVVEQIIFVFEQLGDKFHACCSLSDLINPLLFILLKEDKNWILHLSFEESLK